MEQYGYILVAGNGSYGVEQRKEGHTGTSVGIRWVWDLNAATVFHRPSGLLKAAVDKAQRDGAVTLPAKSTRIVTIGRKPKDEPAE